MATLGRGNDLTGQHVTEISVQIGSAPLRGRAPKTIGEDYFFGGEEARLSTRFLHASEPMKS